ncbi:MAG: tRNA (adenosine(37)-N6)-threonylcarbamoyltransferase complex transferase subunit TsaD [Deltaproteobacteria bacterium]|jgi:N6-L-threonylcarbamoyladenine synthase|nr:tRNA (adenosine(37)-N6)-threonylcarbamoyltransferase complex transferase subunit TsaD [Deltaproteobacteria bacterium]
MLVLGIETSCDETAAAVVRDGTEILSSVVVSQIDVHAEFGGVVPELASRKHSEAISLVLERALNDAGIIPKGIDGIGVTRGPGLIGSLLVGIGAAKGMALALNRPLCGVNHLHGHLFAPFLERKDITFPFVGMVVSGGHTSLYHLHGPLDIEIVGRTRDDAAGEAFDKVAKLLGLGYPGGSIIEDLAGGIDPGVLKFPRALMEKGSLDFSFSGLKTAVLRRVEQILGVRHRTDRTGSFHPLVPKGLSESAAGEMRIIAAAFQEAVVETLAVKAFRAAEKFGVDRLVVSGGVAANGALRQQMRQEGARRGIEPIFPSVALCTDNAAMIASRAYTLLTAGLHDDLHFGAMSRW